MRTSEQKSPAHPGHLPILESDAAVNKKDELILLLATYFWGNPKEKQRAAQSIKMHLPPFVSGEGFREIWEKYMLAAGLRLGLSPDAIRAFPSPMLEKSKGKILDDPNLKAIGFKLKHNRTEGTEAVIGIHPRTVVSSEEMEDPNVRAMVKLVSDFGGGKTVSGSGTLFLTPNGMQVIAFSGHILFDRNLDKSPAQSITAIAGANGMSVIEIRKGSYAVLPISWYSNCVIKQDMGLILLDRPFETAHPMEIRQTPTSEKGTVYGYSSDPPYYGLVLCKSVSVMEYDQDKTRGMVVHHADTFAGNSGGGVVGEDGTLFAIHRGYDKMSDGTVFNHAVAVNREGNDIAAFVAVLNHMAEHDPNNAYVSGDVDFAVKGGAGVEVQKIMEVEGANGFKGLAYTW